MPVIAVVPFANVSGAEVDEWLGSGIADTLIAGLAAQPTFTVIATERLHATTEGAGQTARPRPDTSVAPHQLEATHVVTGGYQRLGDRLRLTARVTVVSTGAVVTSTVVDGCVEGLFALQDRVASDLLTGLRGDEVHRGDVVFVVSQEGDPSLHLIGISGTPRQ